MAMISYMENRSKKPQPRGLPGSLKQYFLFIYFKKLSSRIEFDQIKD